MAVALTINATIPLEAIRKMQARTPQMRRDAFAYVASKVLPVEEEQSPFDTGALEGSIQFNISADGRSAVNGTFGIEYAFEQHENEEINHPAARRHKPTAKDHFISDPTRDVAVPALVEYLINDGTDTLFKP